MTYYVAADTETRLIAPGRLAPLIVCGSWYDGKAGGVSARPDFLEQWADWTAREDIEIEGANFAFDAGAIAHAQIRKGDRPEHEVFSDLFNLYDEGKIYDVLERERLHCIAEGWYDGDPRLEEGKRTPRYDVSLDYCARVYLGESIAGKHGEDAWRLRYRELDDVPVSQYPPAAYKYAELDAQYTYRAARKQRETITEETVPERVARIYTGSAFSLHLIACHGVRTDPAAVDALERDLHAHVDAAVAKLKAAGIYRGNGSKNVKEVRRRVVAAAIRDRYPADADCTADNAAEMAAAICPELLTEAGNVKTDKDTLENSGDAVLELLAEISGDQKLLNTYIPLLRSGTVYPLNPGYFLIESGRTSSRKPNIQNQPRRGGVRECFVARPGCVLVAADYHVAELCALAQVLLDMYGDSRLADVLNAGQDVHLWFAGQMAGIDYETAQAWKRGDYGPECQKRIGELRQLAKAANFGFPGGLGYQAFLEFARATYGVILTEDEARDLKALWLAAFPEMERYFRDIGYMLNSTDTIQHSRTGFVRGGLGFTSACNHMFQHLIAFGARIAVHEVMRECYCDPDSPLYGWRGWAFIHDELIIEGPADCARFRAAAARLEEIMITSMQTVIPDVLIRADAHVMERWYKDAEPVHNEDGELELWAA